MTTTTIATGEVYGGVVGRRGGCVDVCVCFAGWMDGCVQGRPPSVQVEEAQRREAEIRRRLLNNIRVCVANCPHALHPFS